MNNPLISVIVPVYKVEKYLTKCVDSIIMQTYKNLEIILVDDGSPDRCGYICDDYAKIDPRIKVVHKKNGGLSSARNAGLSVASGEFVGFVDSDDYVDKRMYEKLLSAFEDSSVGVTSCMIKSVQDGIESDYMPRWYYGKKMVIEAKDFAYKTLSTERNFTVWSKLYRRNLIGDVYFEEGKINEDILFMFALSQNIRKQNKRMVEIPYYGYYYLQRGDSISNTTDKFLEYSIEDNYRDLAKRAAAYDADLAQMLYSYADLVLLNFYCKAVRMGKKDLMEQLYPRVKNIKLSNMAFTSQKIKLTILKLCPNYFNMIIRRK